MGSIKIYDPVAMAKPETKIRFTASSGLDKLNGKVIGIISNEWRCVKIMMKDLSKNLIKSQNVADFFIYPVEASKQAPKEVLDKAAQKSDAIIIAMAN
jgi:hypothetical protein